jgi:hypothetical protein
MTNMDGINIELNRELDFEILGYYFKVSMEVLEK